jgi:preprotein translocase subunit SecE
VAQETPTPKRSVPERLSNYFREARAELSRVTWSTRQEVIESTQVILVFAFVSMLALGTIDLVFRFLTTATISR